MCCSEFAGNNRIVLLTSNTWSVYMHIATSRDSTSFPYNPQLMVSAFPSDQRPQCECGMEGGDGQMGM